MSIERRRREGAPKRVLLVGWDAADWQMIHPLIEQGLMPTLAGMMERGAWGNLAATRPILSPMLWNTIGTGKRPAEHGVLGFTEPTPEGDSVRPVSSTSRKCKALWNILTQCGLKSNVVGWYASHPAEPIDGVMVSNQFENFRLENGAATPPTAQSVHPVEMAEGLAPTRVHQSEIDLTAVGPFAPRIGELLAQEGEAGKRHSKKLGKLQHMLAQTATMHAATTQLMASTEWDFTAVYYEGIDRFGHEFMEFHPPKMEQVSDEDFEAYRQCMVGIYRFHDMMLETLLTLAGDDTAVIVMSDHGYYNDHLRPDPRPGKAGPVEWHRPFGMLAARGPGVRQGARLYGASQLDVAPTVLELLGLPAAYDMPGRVLAEVIDGETPLPRIETWEEIEGECGMHPADLRVDPTESAAALQQLVDLGYVEAPSEDAAKTVRDTVTSNQMNLAHSLADSFRHREALDVLRSLDEGFRNEPASRTFMATCLLATGEAEQAREVLERLLEETGDKPRIHMMLGSLEFAGRRPEKALEHLELVARADSRLPGLHTKLGEVYLHTKRHALALEAFEKALSIDGESAPALCGLARAQLELSRPQEALDNALIAAELVHHFPRAHLTIGRALAALGDDDGAVEALELCVKQSPGMLAGHKALAQAYRNLGESDKAMQSELRSKSVMA
ncbi:tetratricopeptide repeat protein [Pseudobythopirellula maris]|uniref:Tetratricopeptide repeat protein n=1 Tax=Pseudobythopirellula maris TaxID=2527991 RepID=A0A5C5ZHK6_9BACT|nr:alkaline phosphatase family protein [Pseudobythopirellula maris]TWT86648.1 tetratricopeptide repeat protein [Pseudobythopirellula maris]